MRSFNTAGPIQEDDHYFLETKDRIEIDQLLDLIDSQKYFILHAPRQTGKTSMLLSLMRQLNEEGKYYCIYMNVEPSQTAREDVRSAIGSIIEQLSMSLFAYNDDDQLVDYWPTRRKEEEPQVALQKVLIHLSKNSERPIILFIDEIDALIGDSLVSVLRQLRSGYSMRPKLFPQSVILCGVRDVRDYRIHASSEKDPITGGSAFNIKAKSLRLNNFSEADVAKLLLQHTDETGQKFEPEAIKAVFEETCGQPYLVNALAHDVTWETQANRDRSITITKAMIKEARERLVLRRETHLDQLVHKLREARVHSVIAPLLAGEDLTNAVPDEDLEYVYDLGLIIRRPQIRIANPIYQEVIPRMLTWTTQLTISHETHWYTTEDGSRLDVPKLLRAFQQFFRENSEGWVEAFQYKEAGPQLLLQAFLQRVINGGGRITREYGLGRGRTDLFLEFGEQRVVMELKLLRGSREATIEKAWPQVTRYMDQCGTRDGHLIIFDRSTAPWDDKIFEEPMERNNTSVHVWGM